MTTHHCISHSKPTLGQEEEQALVEVIKSGYIAQGSQVKLFEQELARHIGNKEGVALNSGTSALHLALLALGVKENDQVILPSFTCCALLNAIRYVKAEPVLVDIDPQSYNLDVQAVKKSIGKKTKAVIVPHMFGLPADMAELSTLDIPVIEDCALSLGATYQGKKVGSFGTLAVFSFYATKVITTGEGGMVTSDSMELLGKIKDLQDYDNKDDYKTRFNYKMTDLQAALGRIQLNRLPRLIADRQRIARKFLHEFRELNLCLPHLYKDREHIFYRFIIQTHGNVAEELNDLRKIGIHCARPVYKPLHHYLKKSGFPQTDTAWEKTISLPIYPSLQQGDIHRIISGMRNIYGN